MLGLVCTGIWGGCGLKRRLIPWDGLALPTRLGLVETGITGAHGLNGVWKALYRVYKDSGYRVGNPRINEKCQLTATFNI
jgi:hypothetical protein